MHESIYDNFVSRMVKAYKSVKIGDPLEANTLMGPLHTKNAVKDYIQGLEEIKK